MKNLLQAFLILSIVLLSCYQPEDDKFCPAGNPTNFNLMRYNISDSLVFTSDSGSQIILEVSNVSYSKAYPCGGGWQSSCEVCGESKTVDLIVHNLNSASLLNWEMKGSYNLGEFSYYLKLDPYHDGMRYPAGYDAEVISSIELSNKKFYDVLKYTLGDSIYEYYLVDTGLVAMRYKDELFVRSN